MPSDTCIPGFGSFKTQSPREDYDVEGGGENINGWKSESEIVIS